ncbi:MAG: hypothetical protein MGG11_08775 [Trichodesmium sp. MAG_R03]|nr:hypothetical protein [Trichodesmium sp. MAG_R03]
MAKYYGSESNTLCLKTEYNMFVLEEEIKQVGHKYR